MNPYILPGKPRFVIIDYRASDEIINYLKKSDIVPIKTAKCCELQEPVDGHPDMVIHPVDHENFVVAPNVYDYYIDALKNTGINLIKGSTVLKKNYPGDIPYNVARVGKYAIHNLQYTDEVLKHCLESSGIEFIHVRQGYSKCSTTALNENTALTSDVSIYEKLKLHNIDCLYINPEIVLLKGYNHGFIGGCTGMIDDKAFLSTGKIRDKNISDTIKDFIVSEGYTYNEASSEQIIDLGTIIPIV